MLGTTMRPPMPLRNFLHEYKTLLQTDLPAPITDEDVQKRMNLLDNTESFDTIANSCALDQLCQKDDPTVTKFIPGFSESCRKTTIAENEVKLITFRKLREAKGGGKNQQKNSFQRSIEIFKLAPLPPETKDDKCNFYDDLIVNIRIYRPARSTHMGRTLEKPVFAEEFECLGSNFLTELRDKISCVCNKQHFFDISENPNAPLPTKTEDPGYFFITDTFYNDHRNANNMDYSATIREWAARTNGLKNVQFKVARMDETRFIDLTVSIGFPQLYQHHGNCEHVFTISQVELLTPAAKALKRCQYPRLSSFSITNNRMCNMCGLLTYVYIVEDSDRMLHNPGYMCQKCFISYHYVDGKKIGKFKAYRVVDILLDSDNSEELQNSKPIEKF